MNTTALISTLRRQALRTASLWRSRNHPLCHSSCINLHSSSGTESFEQSGTGGCCCCCCDNSKHRASVQDAVQGLDVALGHCSQHAFISSPSLFWQGVNWASERPQFLELCSVASHLRIYSSPNPILTSSSVPAGDEVAGEKNGSYPEQTYHLQLRQKLQSL